MKHIIKRKILDESGISLIEVIASVVILTIILVGFLGMFISSAKTTKNSDEIVNATYVAQTEMETIYAISRSSKNELNNIYDKANPEDDHQYETYNHNFFITIKIIEMDNNLTRVIVKVYENENDLQPKALVQNTVEWRF